MKGKPKISVIVPIYKAEQYLKICIDSILSQSFKDFEVILIDDGSPDRCPDICDAYKKKDGRIIVIHKQNEGLVKARETGVFYASGEYIGFVDSDDWVEVDWLQKISDIIDNYGVDVICFNTYINYLKRQDKVEMFIKQGYYGKEEAEKNIYPFMLYDDRREFYRFGIYPSICSKIYKKEIYDRCKCTDSRITMGEDTACVYRCLLEANNIYILNDYFYHYRYDSNSMTNAYDKNRFEKYKILLEYLYKTIGNKKYGIKRQLKYHEAFLIKHAIHNESKAKQKFAYKVHTLQNLMNKYNFENTYKSIEIKKANFTSKCFIYFARKKNYVGLMLICEVFNKLKE